MLGPGLIGGSLLKSVRKVSGEVHLRAWARRDEAVAALEQLDVADLATRDLLAAVDSASLVILCVPVHVMPAIIDSLPGDFLASSGALVTDVGSVKKMVDEELASRVERLGGVFLGSHPMAGSEKTGLEFATADLFSRAPVILTPRNGDSAPEQLDGLRFFWETLGANVSVMSPEKHDELVAGISHLPHLLASALVNSVFNHNESAPSFVGGGFRDTTRVAAGPPPMWTEIFSENRDALVSELERFQEELEKWHQALTELDREELQSFLSRAAELRSKV